MPPPISIFLALADPTRCRIVEILRTGPQPVHVLASRFAISRPAISRHLRVLKQARLISEKKTGRENLYRLHAKKLEPAQNWIGGISSPAVAEATAKTPPKPRKALAPKIVEITVKPPSMPAVSQMGFDF